METPNKTTFVKLTDLEAELREMESLITKDMPLELMPDLFIMKYVNTRAQIDAKKEEIRKQIKSFVENGLLNEKDAQPFVNGIDSPDLDLKGPVCGYDCFLFLSLFPCPNDNRFLQSSNEIRMKTEAKNRKLLEQMRKQAEEIEALRAQLNKKETKTSVTRKTFDPVAIAVELGTQDSPKLTRIMSTSPALMETMRMVMQLHAELRQLAPDRFHYYGSVLDLFRESVMKSKSVEDLQKENERFIRYMQNEKAIVESKNQAMKKMMDVITRLEKTGMIDISGIDDEPVVLIDSTTPEDVFDPVAHVRNMASDTCGKLNEKTCIDPVHVKNLQKLVVIESDLISIAPEAEMYYDHTLMLYQYALSVDRTLEERVSLSDEFSLYLDDQKIMQRQKKESFDDAMRVINKLEKALNKL